MELFEGSGHFPPLDARERWSARVLRLPGVRRVSYSLPGLCSTEHEFAGAARPRRAGRRADHRLRARGRRARRPRQAVARLPPGRAGARGARGRPATRAGPGWLDRALQDFRVLLLDQRGTGRSTPVTGPSRASTSRTSARTRSCATRSCCARRWASTAGACSARASAGCASSRYLSLAPEGLREALITGGVPGIGVPVDDVYRATWARMIERNRRYYARFPEDASACARWSSARRRGRAAARATG